MVGILQAESNKATVYALPSIHLPLTREASVVVRGEAMDVLLRRLWEWRGSVQREEQARQGCLKRVCPRALQGRKANQAYTALHRGEGVWGFGKDAEIERPKALQDAKPTKRSYRDREFALFL